MATITSTIKLVDQMTPTLNKISKAVDRVNARSKAIGNGSVWNGFTAGAQRATKSTHNLYNALRRAVFLIGTLRGLRGLTELADTMMSATARINNVNDGLYTTSQYLDIIYSAAQRSRGSFVDMANSVGKLGTIAGDAFGSVNEMIAFTELMNKLFVISGASAAEASNAMYQLTQAMAAGKLQGDEMRSIMENAPLLAQKIADKIGVTKGEVKELGAEGKITADIIKEALFDAADDIEAKFANMPKTIGQTWTEIKNHAINSFRPVITAIQNFINSPMFESFKNRLFSIITSISNAVIRLFELMETPRIQNAISKICTAFSTLWDIAVSVGTMMVNLAIWISDNWSWIGQIVYAVITAVLLYKAVMLATAAKVIIANIAQGVSAWTAALAAGQAWAWVILIIGLAVAAIYLVVAAWNYFTGQTVSATGIIFGAVAFVVACIADLFVFLWDVFMSIVNIVISAGKLIVEVFKNLGQVVTAFIGNLVILLIAVIQSIGTIIVTVGNNIIATFAWLGEYLGVWAANISIGMNQLTQNLPMYWEYFKASVVAKFWEIVVSGGEAFNNLLVGCSNVAKAMVKPFENFANAVIDLINGIIRGWNSMVSSLSFTVPGVTVFGKKLWDDTTVKPLGNHISELGKVSWTNWSDPSGINLGGAKSNLQNAINGQKVTSVTPINWSFFATPEYTVDWSNTGTSLKEMWSGIEWMDFGVDFGGIWDELKSSLSKTWDSSQYFNPVDAYKNWYDKGSSLENGITGLIEGIGGLLDGLFGKGSALGNGLSTQDAINEKLLMNEWANNNGYQGSGGSSPINGKKLPVSLKDLIGGYGSGGSGKGISDALDAIKKSSGSTAGSTASIEDELDLAEDELELLRKLAEQEIINRFTTAEIKVDMTNNNNINSKMDLDGIVTHLSNKLYEELGVVANGVHY